MADLKLISTRGKPAVDASADLHKQIMDLIYAQAGTMPLATAIGVLEIAKADLIADHTGD